MRTVLLLMIFLVLWAIGSTLGEIHTDLHNYVGAPLHP